MSFGIDNVYCVYWGEGSSGDSIVIRQSADKSAVNRRCFLPPLSSFKIGVIPKFSTKKKLII
jgi:hypothetical protein